MARKLRVEYPGAVCHVLNRGDRREAIFRDDADRQHFVETFGEACGRSGWQVHTYCLMQNHVHLVVETPQPTLVTGMKWLLGQMSERLGREHYGEERQESQAEQAERVVGEEWRRRGWTEAALGERAKGHPEKVKIAVRLRKETLVTVAWVARRIADVERGQREHAAVSLAAGQ